MLCIAKRSQTARALRYGYYFASSSGMRVSQGVKKSITIMQLIQVVPAFHAPLPAARFCMHPAS